MKLSFAILTHNEDRSLYTLLSQLSNTKHEIVVVDDFSDNLKTLEILNSFKKNISLYKRKLNRDFASQKNFLGSKCNGDYIINADADELFHSNLLEQLPEIITANEAELVWIPRVNTVEGITSSHIEKWNWQINDKGWINFPDYQARAYKNVDYIYWEGKVHETIKGAKTYAHLPPNEEWCLIHNKKIAKQMRQNEFYDTI